MRSKPKAKKFETNADELREFRFRFRHGEYGSVGFSTHSHRGSLHIPSKADFLSGSSGISLRDCQSKQYRNFAVFHETIQDTTVHMTPVNQPSNQEGPISFLLRHGVLHTFTLPKMLLLRVIPATVVVRRMRAMVGNMSMPCGMGCFDLESLSSNGNIVPCCERHITVVAKSTHLRHCVNTVQCWSMPFERELS